MEQFLNPELAVWAGGALLLGLILGFLLFGLPARRRAHMAETALPQLQVDKAKAETVAGRIPELESANDRLRNALDAANLDLAKTAGRLDAEQKAHIARVEEIEKMGVEVERKFSSLAAQALGKNAENFLALVSERFDKHKAAADEDLNKRQVAIEMLVRPIGESLTKFDQAVVEIENARREAYGAMNEQVKALADGQYGLRQETGRLVQALRRPKTRGRWGENQLRNVLEIAGMTENIDYVSEKTIEGQDGRLRPDVIVRLPGGKSVIVDAKTPLEAYLSAMDAETDETRNQFMSDHGRQVRDHVRMLASKEYWRALPEAPDFVVMFVPGEAIFAAAMENDASIFDDALSQRVLITTPMTFVALIKAIAFGWQQEKLASSALAVAGLARDLFDRIKLFSSHMTDTGKALRKAVERYNDAVGSLETRVLPTARKLESLGVVAPGSFIPEIKPVAVEVRDVRAQELLPPEPEPQVLQP